MAQSEPHLELVAALKHDLAKYVAWRSANFDDAAWSGPLSQELLDALRADIVTTRGEHSAWEVWDAFAAAIGSWWPSELDAVKQAVEVLRKVGPDLRDNNLDAVASARSQIRDAQQVIRSQLRDLHRRLLREA